jgi:hypothetical protein
MACGGLRPPPDGREGSRIQAGEGIPARLVSGILHDHCRAKRGTAMRSPMLRFSCRVDFGRIATDSAVTVHEAGS